MITTTTAAAAKHHRSPSLRLFRCSFIMVVIINSHLVIRSGRENGRRRVPGVIADPLDRLEHVFIAPVIPDAQNEVHLPALTHGLRSGQQLQHGLCYHALVGRLVGKKNKQEQKQTGYNQIRKLRTKNVTRVYSTTRHPKSTVETRFFFLFIYNSNNRIRIFHRADTCRGAHPAWSAHAFVLFRVSAAVKQAPV